jgi:hypothetical protein
MCPIPNGFLYLARNIFLPSLSLSNHNSQLTLHTDSHVSDIGALRWEGRKTLRAYDYESHPNVMIGKMDVVCNHCQAKKFRCESSGMCCSNGKVKLPQLNPPLYPLQKP